MIIDEQLAGFVDAKGHLTLHDRCHAVRLIYICTSTSDAYLKVLNGRFGGNITQKKRWEYRVSKIQGVKNLIDTVTPYLLIKKEVFALASQWIDIRLEQSRLGKSKEFLEFTALIKDRMSAARR